MNYKKYSEYRHHFTIIELLVVVGIISILMTILLPALRKAKDLAVSSQCQSNMRQCGAAVVGYSGDFDGWVIAGECNLNYAKYNCIGTIMMGMDYAPKVGDFTGDSGKPRRIPFGQVFQCPSLPPPVDYFTWGMAYTASSEYKSNTHQGYGLRNIDYTHYYPGEKHTSNATDVYSHHIKYISLYQPSRVPFMIDNLIAVNDSSNSSESGYTQFYSWNMGAGDLGGPGWNGAALHMRHNRRANVWCPDGHVANWGASDTSEFKVPGAGTMSANNIGYSY